MKSNTLTWQKKTDRNKLAQLLRKNQVCLGTSDTILGLLAPITPEGAHKLNQIKKRVDKPYLILISSKERLSRFIDQKLTPQQQKIVDTCWPGPLTLIFKAKPEYAVLAQSKSGTVGLRVPDQGGLQAILSEFDGLFSTSANKTGQPFPKTLNEVDPRILNAVACVIDDQEQKPEKASTILDCSGPEIKVIREGAFSIEQLRALVGSALHC